MAKTRLKATRNYGADTIIDTIVPVGLFRACDMMTGIILAELGHGDGENGGKGDLENCANEIYQFLLKGRYVYADCEFEVVYIDGFVA